MVYPFHIVYAHARVCIQLFFRVACARTRFAISPVLLKLSQRYPTRALTSAAGVQMAARDIRRVCSTNSASTCGLAPSGHEYNVAAGNVMFSDILNSCFKVWTTDGTPPFAQQCIISLHICPCFES